MCTLTSNVMVRGYCFSFRWQALGQLMTMFAILGGVYYLSALYNAPSRNPAVSCLVNVCVCVWKEGVGVWRGWV